MQRPINHALPPPLPSRPGLSLRQDSWCAVNSSPKPPISPGATLCRKTRETFIEACCITKIRAHSYPFLPPQPRGGRLSFSSPDAPLSEMRIRASLYPHTHTQPPPSGTTPTSREAGKLASTPPAPCRLPPAGNGDSTMQ